MELSLSALLAHLLPLGCVVAASFLQSLTGFGLAIVLAPLLMFFYDAKEVVSLVLLICVTGNLVQGVMHFREADRRLVAFLFAGVVLGQPIGAWIFFALSSDTLKFCINAMVLASLLITHVTHARFRETDANAMKTGVLSGITMVLIPSISTFYISQKLGNGKFYLIGDAIEGQYVANNLHFAAAIAFIMMIILLVCMALMQRLANRKLIVA